MSLRMDCADVVFMNVSYSAKSTWQTAEWAIRIGQKVTCSIYLVVTVNFYDFIPRKL